MAATSFSFLKEGLLLPARNPGLFGPILALIVAENVLHVFLATMLPLDLVQDVILVRAVNLLASVTVTPVVGAITTTAAMTSAAATMRDDINNNGETPSLLQILRRLFHFHGDGGGLAVVATVIRGQIIAAACQIGLAALLFLVELVARYTCTLVLLDLLVLVVLVYRLAQLYLGVVLSMAVVVSASEPGCHRAAALRRAWALTARNADQAVILLVAKNVPSREFVDVVYLLMSSVARVFYVCAVTAYYDECRRTVEGIPAHLLLIETGMDWLKNLPIRCRNKLQEILQGRFSMRHTFAAFLARLRCLCIWMFAFVSTHPWVASIVVACAVRLIVEGPPAIFYRNSLVSYRNHLRRKYHIYPNGCVYRG